MTAPSSPVLPVIVALATAAASAQAASPMTAGEVVKVDRAQGRVTLKHAEIRSMEIPAMTMTYRVKDKAQLESLKPGDKVQFSIDRIDSQYTVVAIEPKR